MPPPSTETALIHSEIFPTKSILEKHFLLGRSTLNVSLRSDNSKHSISPVPAAPDINNSMFVFISAQTGSLNVPCVLQSDCRINLVDRIGENYILKATLDEFDEYRMKKNMSDEMKYKEKVREAGDEKGGWQCPLCYQVECFTALASIAHKINERDADMRSHIVLSMFKVSQHSKRFTFNIW